MSLRAPCQPLSPPGGGGGRARCRLIGNGLHQLSRGQPGDHLDNGQTGPRMPPARCYFGQRPQHESPLMYPWMRQVRLDTIALHPSAKRQEIQVEGSGHVWRAPDPAKLRLDRVQPPQQRRRCQFCCDGDNTIDKPGLVGRRHRSTAIPARPSNNPDARRGDRAKRGLASRARIVIAGCRQICAQPDKNHVTPASSDQILDKSGQARYLGCCLD